jgi:ribonuclease J
MSMKFYAIGGFNLVGKNMCALEINDEIVIFDMGVDVSKLVNLDDENLSYEKMECEQLWDRSIIPNDYMLRGKNVVGIVLSHGHLDHVNGVPKLAPKYDCPIIGTPYTIEVTKRVIKNSGKKELLKKLKVVNYREIIELSENIKIELVRTTHSIPQASTIVVHSPEGVAVIAYDYKLDNTPTFGQKPDYKRFTELGELGVKLMVCETVHIDDCERAPSERVAQLMVFDAIDRAYKESSSVFISTFASQVARIKSIIDANNSNSQRRNIIILGRSMKEYLESAQYLGMIDLTNCEIGSRKKEVEKLLKKVEASPHNYLVVCTGNQGEKNSVLSRIARKELNFRFSKQDQVIFSSTVIPSPVNLASRHELENNLREQGVRILRNVHVSGHAMREDHRDLIRIIKPKYLIPCHGETERLASFAVLAEEEGYVLGNSVFILTDGRYVILK